MPGQKLSIQRPTFNVKRSTSNIQRAPAAALKCSDFRKNHRSTCRSRARSPRSRLSALRLGDDAENSETWLESRDEILGLPKISQALGETSSLTGLEALRVISCPLSVISHR